jgi:cysteine synthase A
MKPYQAQHELIGNTPILKIPSLSKLTGSNIFVKCEAMNPGGSIKDRAARQIIEDALECGALKPGMTVVEGTAGNTGIGLSLVAKSLGLEAIAVMPRGQAIEKQRMIELFGGQLKLVDAVPFANEQHFYHTARRMAEDDPQKYFWANQFENLSNYRAHYLHTGPEINAVFGKELNYLVSVAGTGGTIGGNSDYLKEVNPDIKVHLVDPDGSGLFSFFKTGEFKSNGGSSFTEGIGIMRLVENFKKAKIDDAFNLDDQYLYTVARYVRDKDGIVLGSSSALNVAGAFHTALSAPRGSNILTFMCDLGERSYSKMYNPEFLQEKGIDMSKSIDDYR